MAGPNSGRPVDTSRGSDQDVCPLRISLFFHSGTCECFEENVVFFFSEGEYATNFVVYISISRNRMYRY